MYECFYIVEVRSGWYQLHITDTHYCLGAGEDLEALLMTIKRLVKRYRTKEKLLKRLSEMEDGGKVNANMHKVYSAYYSALHHYYDGVVRTTVREVIEEIKNDSIYNRVKRRIKPVTTKVNNSPQTTTKEVMEEVTIKKPRVVKRPKCLICK